MESENELSAVELINTTTATNTTEGLLQSTTPTTPTTITPAEELQSNKLTMEMISNYRRLGQSVNVTVERFVTVGEAIAESSTADDGRLQMYAACEEARTIGAAMERLFKDAVLHDSAIEEGSWQTVSSKASMVRTARSLLGAVTKVLLIADGVIVKHLLLGSKQGLLLCSNHIESVTNFIEFAKSFSQFGIDMVELSHGIIADHQINFKAERRHAQLSVAQCVLERSAFMLLTAAKVCSMHPNSSSARENRDTVFCQMRRAMDLIHYVVKDGIMDAAASLVTVPTSLQKLVRKDNINWEGSYSLSSHLQRFLEQVELIKVTTALCPQARQELPTSLEFILERVTDYTDSAYTSHEDRENILLLCDRVRLQLNHLLRVGVGTQLLHYIMPESQKDPSPGAPNSEFGPAVDGTIKSIVELRSQLQETALLQATEMLKLSEDAGELVEGLRNSALTTDRDRLEDVEESFSEHLEHSQEVCKLLRHICPDENLSIQAKYTEINLRIYGPQIPIAAKTLCSNPTSEIAKDNLNLFIGMWKKLISDMYSLVVQITEVCRTGQKAAAAEQVRFYTSLPRPGKHGTTQKQIPKPPDRPVMDAVQPETQAGMMPIQRDAAATTSARIMQQTLAPEEKAKIAKTGLEMKEITTDLEAEADKWTASAEEAAAPEGEQDNEIVRKAKIMSNMAYNMYQFTRGEGALRTTQDLFTQAEYFAEEANRLYKVVRQFSYMVPTSTEKKDLLEKVDEVPTRVQQLQFKVKNPTVGKAATFTKVDSVIQDTKDLMAIISGVVTTCFYCARIYSLRMSAGESQSGRGGPFRAGSGEGGDGGEIGYLGSGDSKLGGTSGDGMGGMGRQYGMSRRAAKEGKDGRRTRVSFLLF